MQRAGVCKGKKCFLAGKMHERSWKEQGKRSISALHLMWRPDSLEEDPTAVTVQVAAGAQHPEGAGGGWVRLWWF